MSFNTVALSLNCRHRGSKSVKVSFPRCVESQWTPPTVWCSKTMLMECRVLRRKGAEPTLSAAACQRAIYAIDRFLYRIATSRLQQFQGRELPAVQQASQCWESNICTLLLLWFVLIVAPAWKCAYSSQDTLISPPLQLYIRFHWVSSVPSEKPLCCLFLSFSGCRRNNQCPNNWTRPFQWARWLGTV